MRDATTLFQSHNGAIAAGRIVAVTPIVHSFQSHNGAIAARKSVRATIPCIKVSIPQWCDCCKNLIPRTTEEPDSFNPTMVRLLLVTDPLVLRNFEFQSHNGAIAAASTASQVGP